MIELKDYPSPNDPGGTIDGNVYKVLCGFVFEEYDSLGNLRVPYAFVKGNIRTVAVSDNRQNQAVSAA